MVDLKFRQFRHALHVIQQLNPKDLFQLLDLVPVERMDPDLCVRLQQRVKQTDGLDQIKVEGRLERRSRHRRRLDMCGKALSYRLEATPGRQLPPGASPFELRVEIAGATCSSSGFQFALHLNVLQ